MATNEHNAFTLRELNQLESGSGTQIEALLREGTDGFTDEIRSILSEIGVGVEEVIIEGDTGETIFLSEVLKVGQAVDLITKEQVLSPSLERIIIDYSVGNKHEIKYFEGQFFKEESLPLLDVARGTQRIIDELMDMEEYKSSFGDIKIILGDCLMHGFFDEKGSLALNPLVICVSTKKTSKVQHFSTLQLYNSIFLKDTKTFNSTETIAESLLQRI